MSSFVTRSAGDFVGYVALFQEAPESWRPAPAELRTHLTAQLDAFRQDCRSRGVAEAEIEHARFALAAWADEQVLASGWSAHDVWERQPLQLDLFHTVRAGNEFYERLTKLAPGEDQALEIFFLCLLMGFQGELAAEPERRALLTKQIYEGLHAKRRVVPALEGGELAAQAYSWEFTDQRPAGRRVAPVLASMLLVVTALYALCWVALRLGARDILPLPEILSWVA